MNVKSKAMFIGTVEAINNAYSAETKEKLFEMLDFLPGTYIEKDIIYTDGKFERIEYIFSTWGMISPDTKTVKKVFPSLKAVFYAAGTVQYFAKPFMENGIRIFSAWGANAVPVAEFTVSQILLANKGYFHTLKKCSEVLQADINVGKIHPGNFDTPVGIIGAGMIGTLVIKELVKHRLNVSVFDPFMSFERASLLGVKKEEKLPMLFEKCLTVSNHLADNEQTAGIINKDCFDKMGKNAVFINTGRGRQVVESDLIKALKNEPGRIALLDVTYPEPPLKNSEFHIMPNVFLTPHIAGSLGNEIQRMGEYMLDEFTAYINGEKTEYEVTPDMLKTMA